MKIHRYEKCIILTLFTFKRLQLELVFASSNYRIAEHSHDNQDIELIPLFCHNIRFWRKNRGELSAASYLATFKDIGKKFSVPAGASHWFEVSSLPLVFLNIEKWKTTPTSAAVDLQLTIKEKEFYGTPR